MLRDAERWLEPADLVDTIVGMRERPESPLSGMVVVDIEDFFRLPGESPRQG